MRIKIRVCELEKGDRFIMNDLEYRVSGITDKEIQYRNKWGGSGGGFNHSPKFTVARHSKRFIWKLIAEVIEMPKAKEIKRPEAVYSNSGHWQKII